MKRFCAALLSLALLLTCCPGVYAAETTGVMTLRGDVAEAVAVNEDTVLDLNGFSITGTVTVAEGCTLTVKDSQTDDYTIEDDGGYGKLTDVVGNVVAADGYLQISEGGISFHKVDLRLTSVTLRPDVAGIYYNGEFFGDEVVAETVEHFGIALRLDKAPDAAYMKTSSAYSWYDTFEAGADGNTASGTLLKNIMSKSYKTAENKSNSQRKIHGSAYIHTKDGRYIFGESQPYTLMRVTQLADAQWSKLTQDQKNAIKKMYDSYESIISTWYLPNINDTDIDIPI